MSENALHTLWPVQKGHFHFQLEFCGFLLDLFLAGCLRAEYPFGFAMYICLVLDRDAAEVAKDVLHLGIGLAASSTAHVVDRLHADKDVVDHGDDDDNANRISPDDNNGDNGRLSTVVITSELIDGFGEEL